MSSLRNAVSRRDHKERAQPHSRRKFGLLEKHKDYVVRAQSYHKKEEYLRTHPATYRCTKKTLTPHN
ncbi:unnamed protein product [Ilex paraguariensis]|uniref:Uncharacterized protein n=1 Tax=Ilex paraguariensis TaxID=185542 RepID=A0ABC8U3C6_9AQUA